MSETAVSVDVSIDDDAWARDVLTPVATVEAAISSAQAVSDGPVGEVSVLLANDDALHVLNQTWRQKDAPTDVLAFPAGPNGANFLGDVAIAHGVCVRDAADLGRPLRDHLAHMAIHAYLHLAGYEHESDQDALIMEELEDRALERLGLPAPRRSFTQDAPYR